MQRDPLAQVLDALELLRRGAADHAVHLIALLQQQLGQVGAVLAGDPGDQRARHAAACSRLRSHSTVWAMPSRTPMRAFQPSSRSAFSTDGQRRRTSTVKLGRCSSSNAAGSLPHASQQMRAISATVSSSARGDVEVLVEPGGMGHGGDDPVGDVVDVRERPGLLARAEDGQRAQPGQRLADQVRHGVGDPRLRVGHLARPVGVERAADRVREPVLVMGGAAVDLAGQLGEAVGRERHGAVVDVVLARRVLLGALEDHRGGDVHEALHVGVQRGPEDGVVERVVDLGERVRELVEVRDPADDRRQVDDVRAPAGRLAGLGQQPQIAAVHLAALAHPAGRVALVGDADLEVGVAQQAPHDGRADGAGAAGDEDTVHRGGEASRPVARRRGGACAAPARATGAGTSARPRRRAGGRAAGTRSACARGEPRRWRP